MRDFQRIGGTVCALGYRSQSAWCMGFWQTHLSFVERRALAACGGEGNVISVSPWMLPAGAFHSEPELAAPGTARDPAAELDVRSI